MKKLILLLSKKKQIEYERELAEKSGIEIKVIPSVNKEMSFIMLLIKALIMFLIVMGGLDAYMSGFQIEYDVQMMAGVFGLLAIVFAIANTNTIVFASVYGLSAYFLSAFIKGNFDTLLSGAMALANLSYQLIMDKFKLPSVDGFDEIITDRAITVPIIIIVLAVLAYMVLSPFVCRFMNLMLVAVATFVPLGLVLFFDGKPSGISLAMLFGAWVLTAMVKFSSRFGSIRGKKQMKPFYLGDKIYYRQICDGSVMLQCTLLLLLLAGIGAGVVSTAISNDSFNRSVSKSKLKINAEYLVRDTMIVAFSDYKNYIIDDFEGEGQLGMYGNLEPDFNTDLIIKMVPYTLDRVYFRSYIGSEYPYMANMWLNKATEEAYTDEAAAKATAKAATQDGATVKVNITNVAVPGWKGYMPYYTDIDENPSLHYTQDDVISGELGLGSTEDIVFHPLSGNVRADITDEYKSYVYNNYLQVPSELKMKLAALCSGEGFDASDEQLDTKIKDFFQNNYKYTTKSGRLPWKTDFVEYFLFENKKGVCAHFATSAVLMYRTLGIPARYVEGYCVDYQELTAALDEEDDDNVLDELADESWISGIRPLSEKVMQAELSDYNAHAWVEIYKDGVGWVVADPTPYVTKEEMEEETESGSVLLDIAEYFQGSRILADGLGRIGVYLSRIVAVLMLLLVLVLLSLAIYFALASPVLGFVLCLMAVHRGNRKRAVRMKYDYIGRLAMHCGMAVGNGVFCRELCQALTELKFGMEKEKAEDMRRYIEKALYSKDGVDSDEYKLVCGLIKEARRCILKSAPVYKRLTSVFKVVVK